MSTVQQIVRVLGNFFKSAKVGTWCIQLVSSSTNKSAQGHSPLSNKMQLFSVVDTKLESAQNGKTSNFPARAFTARDFLFCRTLWCTETRVVRVAHRLSKRIKLAARSSMCTHVIAGLNQRTHRQIHLRLI